MFESTLISYLKSDSTLCGYLSTYNASPSIFSEEAPEDATHPYIVTRIDRAATDNLAVQSFSIYTDFYDYNISRINSRKAIERLELLLDYHDMTCDSSSRYSKIRTFFYSGSPVAEADPRSIHYNMQFDARGARKNFILNKATT